MTQLRTERIAVGAVFTALALILSYVESMIPVIFPVPGMKLGLTNLLIVFALYYWDGKQAFVINVMRILLVGFLFGNAFSIVYSLCGGVLSFIIMMLMKRSGKFSMVGVSMAGGIFHNVGQLIAAIIAVSNTKLIYYLPPLLVSGVVTGFLIGILSSEIYKRIKKIRG
ncbi:MAG: Gx transporter family protein [Lachnospiraceae bacterium]|nr:Gx transporter family protein [Lachnospiraceae bacterium]